MSTPTETPDILDPPTLGQTLKAAALKLDDTTSDAAAARIALDSLEKTTALLKAELLAAVEEDNDVPPAKREATPSHRKRGQRCGLVLLVLHQKTNAK